MGGAVFAVLCSEEPGGQRGALARRGGAALRPLPVGQVSGDGEWREVAPHPLTLRLHSQV